MSVTDNAVSVAYPVKLTDAHLISSDVPETDYAAYAAGTTYALGARVIVVADHGIYESVQAANTGNDPLTSPTWWKRVSPTNRWKAFDASNTTRTTKASSMSFRIRPGQAITTLGVLSMVGATAVRVRQETTGGVTTTLFDTTFDTSPVQPEPDWYSWFFAVRSPRPNLIVSGLVNNPTADLLIDVTGTTELGVGVVTMGQERKFGKGARYGLRLGIQDYSRKDTNEYGDTVLTQRAFASKISFDTTIDNADIDWVYEMLASLRSTAVLWSVYRGYSVTNLFGFYKDFEITIPYAVESDCSVELEGLT